MPDRADASGNGASPLAEQVKRWQRRAQREKAARSEAERLLESKSLDLFAANRRLSELNADLEQRVELRTRELVRAAAVRGEFLAAMSHEIRTPMTAVLGMIDLLRVEDLTPTQRGYVDSVHASGRHLLVIINDILDFSRMETGRIEFEEEHFALGIVVERVRSMLSPLARERGLELSFAFRGGAPPPLKGDSTRIIQVLLNLVGNAIKFTLHGSVAVEISFAHGTPGLRLRFEVRDTGIGISSDDLQGVFEAFAQADRSTTRKFGGSGLGLAISKRIVEAMGGTIGVDSSVGRGSNFWFEIPIVEGMAITQDQRHQPRPTAVVARRILVAEDIPLNREVIATMLKRDGHEVVFAENGAVAVELAQQQPLFDLVLMDVQMPVMDGVEATRRIRRLPRPLGQIPIVALTANVMAAEQSKCLEAGMDGVLMKPIDWEKLRGVIAEHGQTPVGLAEAF